MADVTAWWRDPVTAVSVTAWPGCAAALATRLHAAFGLELAQAGRWTETGALVCVWLGPDHWQVEHAAMPDLAAALAAVVGGDGGVIDMSDARAVLRLSGPGSREALARLLPLDLHPRSFTPGHAASTVAAHMNVHVRQIDNVPSYDLGCLRSYADSLWHAVREACETQDAAMRAAARSAGT